MDYGVGRLTLAVNLYCKAAQLQSQGKSDDAARLVAEARQQGIDGPARREIDIAGVADSDISDVRDEGRLQVAGRATGTRSLRGVGRPRTD